MSHDIVTECPIIPDPEMNLTEMPVAFENGVSEAMKLIKGIGIDDEIEVGLEQFTGEQRCWAARYERESQFRGVPRFWVNSQLPGILDAAVLPQKVTVEDAIIDSTLHEYFHVVEEYAKRKNPEMYKLIYGPFSDEEDFAEYGVDYCRYRKDKARRGVVDRVITMYVKDVFG